MRTLCRMPFIALCACGLILPAVAGEEILTPGLDGVSVPKVVKKEGMQPTFPPAASRLRAEGEVSLAVVVSADGSVAQVDVLQSTRPKLGFEQAAVAAIEDWSFEPAEKDGAPVAAYAVVHLRFNAPPRGYGGDGYVTGGVLAPSDAAMVIANIAVVPTASEGNATAAWGVYGAYRPTQLCRDPTFQCTKDPYGRLKILLWPQLDVQPNGAARPRQAVGSPVRSAAGPGR